MIERLAIDPGLSGGIAWYDGSNYHAIAMPLTEDRQLDGAAISQLIHDSLPVCIERQHLTRPLGKGTTTNLINFGYLLGILDGCDVTIVDAKTWKKAVLGTDTKDKQVAIDYCKNNFPEVSLLRTPRCTKDHDALADALCILRYLEIKERKS